MSLGTVTFVDLEFEAGHLVKVRGQRPMHMSGDELIGLVGALGKMLAPSPDSDGADMMPINRGEVRRMLSAAEKRCFAMLDMMNNRMVTDPRDTPAAIMAMSASKTLSLLQSMREAL